MSQEIENYISRCAVCMEYGRKQQETLKSHEVPTRPCQNIACDLMDLGGFAYLVTVDTYSDFIEVDRISRMQVKSSGSCESRCSSWNTGKADDR